jgi:hypothetical protein
MRRIRGRLQPGRGPILTAEISVTQALEDVFRRTRIPIPPPITVNALIDTGADDVVINSRIINALKLYPSGVATIPVYDASGKATFPDLYQIRLRLAPGAVLEIPAAEMALPPSIDCLIGGSFLCHCLFTYDGPGKAFELVL